MYIFLPSLTASTIVVKLSSSNIISAAPFETSVPVIPIATPISALFNDGASLTPSPVIDTIFPLALRAETIFTLCSGETLANTEYFSIFSKNSFSSNLSISGPVILSSILLAIFNSLAIATAVFL